jgi:uncharacterized protein YuzE
MKLHYYPETDSLYIELKGTPGTEVREIVAGLVVDLDANGDVVGLDIDHASRKLDLSRTETIALPPVSAASQRFNEPSFPSQRFALRLQGAPVDTDEALFGESLG